MSFNFGINGTTLMFLHMQKKKKISAGSRFIDVCEIYVLVHFD